VRLALEDQFFNSVITAIKRPNDMRIERRLCRKAPNFFQQLCADVSLANPNIGRRRYGRYLCLSRTPLLFCDDRQIAIHHVIAASGGVDHRLCRQERGAQECYEQSCFHMSSCAGLPSRKHAPEYLRGKTSGLPPLPLTL
jgi:hypothetical protein